MNVEGRGRTVGEKTFSGAVKAELCRDKISRGCCARAEAYGILLFCNTFLSREIRIVTTSEQVAKRLGRLFRRAFQITFDQRPQELLPGGKYIFSITDPDKLKMILDTYGYSEEQLSHHVNYAVLEESCCQIAFFRGAFLAGGSILDPRKRYHLEFTTSHYHVARELQPLMAELDLTANTVLNMLEMSDTPSLTTLHVAGLPYLDYIDVSRCGLTELDVTGCPLYYLECERNPLTSLTLGEKPDLTYLECHHASLTELDISQCPMLKDAYLNGTRSDDEDYVSYDSGDAWLAIDEGVSVTATTYVPGDINGDGKVNLIDAQQLMRYVKYHDVTVVESNLDITGDGRVNLIDAQQLMRYIKYHDVVIH